jgi:DNA-binding transcriptional ArsR family regulator
MEEFVHEAMPATQAPRARFVAGPALETVIGLYAATCDDEPREGLSRRLRRAIAAVGERSSELWLHLLGLALEQPGDIAAAVRATPAAELRRHLVGLHVPAWREIAGVAALEATARGDDSLLDDDRYYAGRARPSLERLLPLTPSETKRRVLAVLELFRDECLEPTVVEELRREAAARNALHGSAAELVAAAVPGYHYVAEPELPEVVLVPHRAASPWLLLCQHDRTRIICYALPTAEEVEGRLVALGRALADAQRVKMLMHLAGNDATLAELAELTQLAKSTAHHHLAQLRTAGLVEMHGNARGYWFSISRAGLAGGSSLLQSV